VNWKAEIHSYLSIYAFHITEMYQILALCIFWPKLWFFVCVSTI